MDRYSILALVPPAVPEVLRVAYTCPLCDSIHRTRTGANDCIRECRRRRALAMCEQTHKAWGVLVEAGRRLAIPHAVMAKEAGVAPRTVRNGQLAWDKSGMPPGTDLRCNLQFCELYKFGVRERVTKKAVLKRIKDAGRHLRVSSYWSYR